MPEQVKRTNNDNTGILRYAQDDGREGGGE